MKWLLLKRLAWLKNRSDMPSQLHLLLLAVSFYTRLPVRSGLDYRFLPQASSYLPVIGWLVGAVTATGFYAASFLWPQVTAVLLALAIGILLTGAFHEDGFADVCDGFGGGYDKQQILAIMRDSQIGSYGALGLFLLMALKISSLCTLPATAVPLSLLAGHSLSRYSPLHLMHVYSYARTEAGKGGAAVIRPTRLLLLMSALSAFLPLLLLPAVCLLSVPLVFLVNVSLGRFFYRHIGGYTGDCLGASQQLCETVFYLSISFLWTFT